NLNGGTLFNAEFGIRHRAAPYRKGQVLHSVFAAAEDYRIGWATARVHQVIEAAEGVIEEGDVLTLKYPISSCGPWHKPGETGAIIAITGTDSDSSVVWFPYFYRESDDRTFAPETEFDW
ncbi:hypothetical protein, partial [Halopseudomonas oceani]|uniref:hypothetical protein n=1 Tax=Halopseudomonas oceani TaxID=1708783 RepID=UPI001E5D631B